MQSKNLHRRAQQDGARVVELSKHAETLQGRIRDLEDNQNRFIDALKTQVKANSEVVNLLRDMDKKLKEFEIKLKEHTNGAR